jgi:putative transferase (TIGR04331 family)
LERLAMNKPIIIFIDKSIWTFSKQSQFFFDNLFKVNIVHYDPINAANFINLNYNSLDEWWYSIDVQKVVEEFTNSYAKNSDSYSDEWKNYLKI